MEIVSQARASIKKHRFDQWQGSYPSEAVFLRDIELRQCFLLRHGDETAGFFVLSLEHEDSYDEIKDGKWSKDIEACILHRAAVAAEYRGSGMSDYLFRAVEQQAAVYGLRCIRTDTHKKNKAMQTLLRDKGYRYRGNVLADEGEGHDPNRQAFEKILKKQEKQ